MKTLRRILRAIGKDRETGWRFTLVLCLIYFAHLLWMHIHHEMWRDEIHAWTLARVADGFWDLVTGDRVYEGHPPLWFWYLRVWSWLVQAAWGIQAATLAAAMAAAVLFVRFAPFPRYLKVLALCSFFFAFEYTVMARNYVLGWLCVCLFCSLYHQLRVRYLALALALAALSLTSVYGLIMSIALLGFLVLDQVTPSFTKGSVSPPARFELSWSPWLVASVASVAGTILFCVLTIEPPDPNPFAPGFYTWALNMKALPDFTFRLVGGFLPWRDFTPNGLFWVQVLYPDRALWINKLLAACLLGLALLSLWRSWRLILVYLGAAAAMEVFATLRYDGGTRHWGHYFMFFLACAWLLRTTFPKRRHWISTVFLTAVLIFQLEAAFVAVVTDSTRVFSGGKETAAFIEREKLQDLPIVGGPDYAVETVAGYLRRPFIAHETEEVNQMVVFHNRRKPSFSSDELVRRAVAVARERKSPVLLITTRDLPDPPAGTTRTQLFKGGPCVVGDETFTVYRVEAP